MHGLMRDREGMPVGVRLESNDRHNSRQITGHRVTTAVRRR